MKNYIFIDGSYFIFFRYFALQQWWKRAKAKPDEVVDYSINNLDFVEKFKNLFIKKIKEISKKMKIENPKIYVGKDCMRADIWRNQYISNYKDGRKKDDNIGDFFKLVYQEDLFMKACVNKILYYDKLEADDCIALSIKKILSSEQDYRIYIISSDHDYGQLIQENVFLYNAQYKNLCDNKKLFDIGEKNLLIKVLTGDKSDNIKSFLPKCGIKTAIKYYENRSLLVDKLKDEDIRMKFEHNNILINFNKIPKDLSELFYEKYNDEF